MARSPDPLAFLCLDVLEGHCWDVLPYILKLGVAKCWIYRQGHTGNPMNMVICYRCHVRQMGTGQDRERSTLLGWDAGQGRLYGKEEMGHLLPSHLYLFYLMNLLLMATASVYTAFFCA